MAKCWTCGAEVSGYHYICSSCKNLTELKKLRKTVESRGEHPLKGTIKGTGVHSHAEQKKQGLN